MKISFIGAGSMAEAIISGIIEKGVAAPQRVMATNRSDEKKLARLKSDYGIQVTYDSKALFDETDIVVLAVKPKDAEEVLHQIKHYLQPQTLFISVLAGISIPYLESILKVRCPIVRAMPNTSATIGKGATALAFNDRVTATDQKIALSLFHAVGIAEVVAEEQLDAITGLSGSGPAYIYYIVEAMEQSAVEIGLEKEMAKNFILQTLSGATEMLQKPGNTAQSLRQAVTSPGGTTEAGINILQQHQVKEAFISCIKEAMLKSKKLGAAFDR